MKKQRKELINSTGAAVQVMVASRRDLAPPANVPLEKIDLPFFDSVLAEFARSEWSNHQLELAAMLARTMADMEREQRYLRDEGSVVKSDKGTPVVNPRKTIVQMHAGTIFSMRRSLSLHARAQSGEAYATAKRREQIKTIENNNPLDDDLIARPN